MMFDTMADVERIGFLRGIKRLRPRSGSVEEFERHTCEAGHPVSWDEARGVFRDRRARFVRAENRFLIIGRSWSEEPILLVVMARDDEGTGTLITARPATNPERRQYRQKGK